VQGAVLHVLRLRDGTLSGFHPFEANGQPWRLLTISTDGNQVIIDPEEGRVLYRAQGMAGTRHDALETEDSRLILATSSTANNVLLFDLGEVAPRGAMLPAANKLG
jgi:hypothetical protein